MTKNKTIKFSEFGEAAMELDQKFLQIERLASELERLNLSDKGIERAQTLLAEVEVCRVQMAAQMQTMAQTLQNARVRNEAAEKIIVERANAVLEKQREGEKLLERFQTLAGMVRKVTEGNLQFQNLKGADLSPEDREALSNHLPQIYEQLGVLVEEANKIMIDSRNAHLKVLERNADSLRQSLHALRSRLKMLAEGLS